MNTAKPLINLYTDGAASPNPGPGGYGVILRCGEYEKELSAGFALTTNNRMELLAVIVGLEAVKWDNAEVKVVSDSSYVVKALNEGWLEEWERKHWRRVKNPDLWQRFLLVYRRHRVTFHWIRGHAGHPSVVTLWLSQPDPVRLMSFYMTWAMRRSCRKVITKVCFEYGRK